jgi:hypothetical protein
MSWLNVIDGDYEDCMRPTSDRCCHSTINFFEFAKAFRGSIDRKGEESSLWILIALVQLPVENEMLSHNSVISMILKRAAKSHLHLLTNFHLLKLKFMSPK